jgi:hypothetical protein
MTTENEIAREEASGGVTALLDAAAAVDVLVDDVTAGIASGEREALRLLASHARESGAAVEQAHADGWRAAEDAMAQVKQEGADGLRRSVDAIVQYNTRLYAEVDAWKRLAMAYRAAVRGVSLRDDAFDGIDDAEDTIRALNIDPVTGERIEEPR